MWFMHPFILQLIVETKYIFPASKTPGQRFQSLKRTISRGNTSSDLFCDFNCISKNYSILQLQLCSTSTTEVSDVNQFSLNAGNETDGLSRNHLEDEINNLQEQVSHPENKQRSFPSRQRRKFHKDLASLILISLVDSRKS